jgi:hypothetical protein
LLPLAALKPLAACDAACAPWLLWRSLPLAMPLALAAVVAAGMAPLQLPPQLVLQLLRPLRQPLLLRPPSPLPLVRSACCALLWYKKPPARSYAYHRNLNLDFDGAGTW